MIRVADLVQGLQSNNKAARMNAIRSLGQIGTGARIAVPFLIMLLDDPDTEIASLSLRVIALMGPSRSLKPEIVQRGPDRGLESDSRGFNNTLIQCFRKPLYLRLLYCTELHDFVSAAKLTWKNAKKLQVLSCL